MFNTGAATPSLADIAAVTKNNDGNNGFGDMNSGWWVLIILLALFGGFGGYGGYGGRGNGSNDSCGTTIITTPPMGGYGMMGFENAAIQRGFDNADVISKLDGINNGICSLGYDQLAQMNGINQNIMRSSYDSTIANLQSVNALSRQLADCCCENRQGQQDIKYAMAKDTCDITTAINQAAQNIMQNDNANYRQLHDENIQLQMQNYRDQIAAKDSLINSLNLAQSQANQNQFFQGQIENLYDKLNPCPKPAYWVQNPNCCQGPWGPFGNGFNGNGCCGNNGSCC